MTYLLDIILSIVFFMVGLIVAYISQCIAIHCASNDISLMRIKKIHIKTTMFSLILYMCGGLSFMFSYLKYGKHLSNLLLFILLMLTLTIFLIISAIDYKTNDIYNVTLLIYLILAILTASYKIMFFETNLWGNILGALFGFVFFGGIKFISKTILKKEALGSGDVYIVGISGAMIGTLQLLIAIIIGTFLGSIIEIIKIKTLNKNREEKIAFAPYLLLGIGLMAIFGDDIIHWYWEVMTNAFI